MQKYEIKLSYQGEAMPFGYYLWQSPRLFNSQKNTDRHEAQPYPNTAFLCAALGKGGSTTGKPAGKGRATGQGITGHLQTEWLCFYFQREGIAQGKTRYPELKGCSTG